MDWHTLIKDLIERGWTQQGIGEHVGTSQGTIGDIYRGRTANPSYPIGKKLEALHTQVTKTKKVAA